MPRRVYLLGVGLALVALVLAFTDYVFGPSPWVTQANVRRIRVVMTPAEVEAVLGGPPVAVGIGPWPDVGRKLDQWPCQGAWVWKGARGAAWVWMDGSSRVQHAEWVPNDAYPGLLARLRAWLGR
jgi:hypothetical protein